MICITNLKWSNIRVTPIVHPTHPAISPKALRRGRKMARFENSELSIQHPGITRVSRGFEALGNFSATHAVLALLAFIGSPLRRAAAKVGAVLEKQAEVRRARREDERLWNVALTDARVMADLSRAMSRDATRDVRGYY